MSVDLSGVVSAITESANAVSAMIASLVTLFGVLRFKRRARAVVASGAPVRGGAGVATLQYLSNPSTHGTLAVPASPAPMIYAPQGTITKLPRWVTSTHTPLAIIGLLLISLVTVMVLRRSTDVRPVPEQVAPTIADARATAYVYDTTGSLVSDNDAYIVFNVSGTWDGVGRETGVSIPAVSGERSEFTWIADLKNIYGTEWRSGEIDPKSSASLHGACGVLRSGNVAMYSIANVGNDHAPTKDRMVYVYAHGVGEDNEKATWIKVGEGAIDPSGGWSVVGTVFGDRASTLTTRGAATTISLAAIVVSPQEGVKVGVGRRTTALSTADLDGMGRSEIVTVVPHRGLQWRSVSDSAAGASSGTMSASGVHRER